MLIPGGLGREARLGELFDYFAATDQLELLRLIICVASAEAHPENAFELTRLRYGVQILCSCSVAAEDGALDGRQCARWRQ